MALLDIIRKRYSCRAYQQRSVEQEKLDQLFEAARLAPSAKNTQDWRFVVATDEQVKRRRGYKQARCIREGRSYHSRL